MMDLSGVSTLVSILGACGHRTATAAEHANTDAGWKHASSKSDLTRRLPYCLQFPGFIRHHVTCTGAAATPDATSHSRISASRLVTSSLTTPFPLHSTSPAAAARGQRLLSRLTPSVCSAHMCTSPPSTRCRRLRGTSRSGS